ncbi:MAG TPA: suppressor of fused domain protein [Kofleriaceae bacterium]|nr:suppressor of fused domain protein [Kofleriaceae bacterium]
MAGEDDVTDLAGGIVSDAPGWEAIESALSDLYGEQAPIDFVPSVRRAMGGKDPLDRVAAYRAEGERPHWHIVTYGLSELYMKEREDPTTSGFGFELTLRLARPLAELQPPRWAIAMIQNLARYVFDSGKLLEPGHHLNANGPIARDHATALRGLLFVTDPELPAIETPNGRLEFVQTVGVTIDELVAIEAWDGSRFAELLAARDGLFVTDLARGSVLDDPATLADVRAATERDGSSMGAFSTERLQVTGDARALELTVSANVAGYIGRLMRGRLLHERPLTVRAPQIEVLFEPAPVAEWKRDGEALVVDTTPALAHEIAATIAARPGVYAFRTLPGFTIRVQ